MEKTAKRIQTTRLAFIGNAPRSALKKIRVSELERKHREGYRRKPVKPGEFSVWEGEQVWGKK
jgi:hypothetical protein